MNVVSGGTVSLPINGVAAGNIIYIVNNSGNALARFPLVQRDLAVVVNAEAESAMFRRVIEQADVPVRIENVTLFDTYAGVGMLPGKKSLAYTFTLRAEDHTLTDEEIKGAMDAVIAVLAANGAPLRS